MRRFFATFLVAMLATAGLAACGGDDDDDVNAATEADDDSGDSDDGDGDDDGDDDSDDDSDDDDGDDDSDDDDSDDEMDDELADLVERQSSARIRITYEMSGEEETTTYSQDGEGRTAIFTGTSSVFVSGGPDGAFSCDGLDTDEPTCSAIPEGMEELATIGLTLFAAIGEGIAQQSEDLGGVDTSEEEIAGRDATCYDWDASALLGGFGDIAEDIGGELEEEDLEGVDSARVCIDDETGWLLELSSEGDDAESFLAIEVGEPLDSDFEAPAPIEESGFGFGEDLDIDELVEEDF